MQDEHDPKYEIKLKISYAIELNKRHAKLYRKLKFLFSLTFLIGGMSILSNFDLSTVQQRVFGTFILISSVFSFLIDPSDKAAKHVEMRRRWLELQAKADELDITALNTEYLLLQSCDLHTIDAVNAISYRNTLLLYGHEQEAKKLSPTQRFISLLT